MTETHELHFIYDVKVVGDHSLRLTFEDHSVKTVDLSGFWYGELFKPLRDPAFFRQVKLNEECHIIEWPNGADFDPETLYYWDRYRDDMLAMAEEWRLAESNGISSTKEPSIFERQRIAITKDIPALGLISGDIGTVVGIYADGKAFEVEFMSAKGKTIDVLTLEREDVHPFTGHEILHIREMEIA
jgi:hypothetical protein